MIRFQHHSPFCFSFIALALAVALALPLQAQNTDGDNASGEDAPPSEVEKLKSDLAQLREEFQEFREQQAKEAREERRSLTVFGDIGVRFQGVDTTGKYTNTIPGAQRINRMEYRVRLGVTGFILDREDGKHRTKYLVRLSTLGVGDYPAPLGTPTEGWRPVDAFGSETEVHLDRLVIQHDYKQWLRVGGGRFGSIFQGTQLVFDNDLPLSGVYARLDLGYHLGAYSRVKGLDSWATNPENVSFVDRVWLQGAFYYLAQNNIGLPNPDAEDQPYGSTVQLAARLQFGDTETVWTNAIAYHDFTGTRAIATNIGTGSTPTSTNTLFANGTASSSFRIVDVYSELILLEQHISSLRFFGHVAYNLGAKSPPGVSDRHDAAFLAGAQWGALDIDEGTRPFRLAYTYYYIEPNAVIPEFNNDTHNTNFKGQGLSLQVSFTPGLLVSTSVLWGKRVDANVGGLGRRQDGSVGSPSTDTETRYRIGIVIRF